MCFLWNSAQGENVSSSTTASMNTHSVNVQMDKKGLEKLQVLVLYCSLMLCALYTQLHSRENILFFPLLFNCFLIVFNNLILCGNVTCMLI